MRRAVVVAALLVAGAAAADPESDADAAFRAAEARAAAGDAGALDALEALGAAQPATRWTDDAWAEAARLAERAGDPARARRDLERAVAAGEAAPPAVRDEALVRRARGELARLAAITGGGQWDAVAAEHERLASVLAAPGDPKPALAQLGALVRANPGYPRAVIARIAIARGWERDGDADQAIAWLREAIAQARGADVQLAHIALVRVLARHGAIADARAALAAFTALPDADRGAANELRGEVALASQRAWVRRGAWAALALLAALALARLWRDAGSVRAALRRLARAPLELYVALPLAAGLVLVAWNGNPLAARAIRTIALGALALAWLSGALLDAARARHGRLGARRALLHALLAAAAATALVYLALDRDRLLDMVSETWQHGPQQL